ncbi:hypothetical protein HK405_006648 [Cladochytrium tenue]|nr:hypothetical protein HK405_006648 [Cladochytrium tenue]
MLHRGFGQLPEVVLLIIIELTTPADALLQLQRVSRQFRQLVQIHLAPDGCLAASLGIRLMYEHWALRHGTNFGSINAGVEVNTYLHDYTLPTTRGRTLSLAIEIRLEIGQLRNLNFHDVLEANQGPGLRARICELDYLFVVYDFHNDYGDAHYYIEDARDFLARYIASSVPGPKEMSIDRYALAVVTEHLTFPELNSLKVTLGEGQASSSRLAGVPFPNLSCLGFEHSVSDGQARQDPVMARQVVRDLSDFCLDASGRLAGVTTLRIRAGANLVDVLAGCLDVFPDLQVFGDIPWTHLVSSRKRKPLQSRIKILHVVLIARYVKPPTRPKDFATLRKTISQLFPMGLERLNLVCDKAIDEYDVNATRNDPFPGSYQVLDSARLELLQSARNVWVDNGGWSSSDYV